MILLQESFEFDIMPKISKILFVKVKSKERQTMVMNNTKCIIVICRIVLYTTYYVAEGPGLTKLIFVLIFMKNCLYTMLGMNSKILQFQNEFCLIKKLRNKYLLQKGCAIFTLN